MKPENISVFPMGEKEWSICTIFRWAELLEYAFHRTGNNRKCDF